MIPLGSIFAMYTPFKSELFTTLIVDVLAAIFWLAISGKEMIGSA
jgi:hypothetical protein